ncbi:hypothetical protein TrST_g4843 [Triparma strigata]|uniref:Uncharacterized protein n=1 Tax=Triparma strigata TaxID=1606541 RepID=A0A9W7BHT3_9STRA|nr:hypothetical protein TrST_g4843 [Triparma strigata]
MNSSIKLLFLCLLASPAFVRPFLRSPLFRALPTSRPNLAAKSSKPKGFGSSPPPPQTPKSPPLPSSSSGSPPAKVSEEAARLVNTGAVRLAELEAKKVSQKASILDTAISLTEEDNAAREGGGVIPEQVAGRMTQRMWGFVGVPFGGCVALFCWFYYQAKVENVRYEPMLVASGTVGLLVVGLLGITYSLLSASWDDEEEGSEGIGGVKTFNDNLDRIKEGVGRGRKNIKARDTIDAAGGIEEINRVREQLEAKEEKAKLKARSLKEKMEDEMKRERG